MLYYGNEEQDCSGCGTPTLAFVLGNIPVCECCKARMDKEDDESAEYHP